MPLDLDKLQDSDHLIDLLVQMEDVLDSLDTYVFRHWIDGEVVEGPTIRRHWVSFGLLYPHDRMPDPRAALRLLKHGIKVEFSRVHRAQDPQKKAQRDTSGQDSPVGSKPQEAPSMAWAPADRDKDAHAKPDARDTRDPASGGQEKKRTPALWMVKVTFPRRLLDQMEAADVDAYEDEVDTGDVRDAEDAGLDGESAYMTDEQAPGGMGGDPGMGGPPGMAPGGPGGDPMAAGAPPPGMGGPGGF